MTSSVFYHFQKAALTKWRRNNYRGAIFFEPGLGKSYLSQHALRMLIRAKKTGLALIVMPAIIIDMWEADLNELGYKSGTDILVIRAGVTQRDVDAQIEKQVPKIIVTTYTLFRARTYPKPDMYILDESHNIKSSDSKAYLALRKMITGGDKVLLLSGTPLPSGIEDFYSQFMLIKPGYLASSLREFRMLFERIKYKGAHSYVPKKDKLGILRRLVREYASFKKAVDAIELPPVTYSTSRYPLSKKQMEAYAILKEEGLAMNEAKDEDSEVFVESPAIRMLLLQQMCSGFASMNIKDNTEGEELDLSSGILIGDDEGEEVRIQIDLELRDSIEKPIPKEELLMHDLENLVMSGSRALVWINFTKTATRLNYILNKSPILKSKFETITGKTSKKKRNAILDRYDKGEILFILAHPKTLGTGLNRFSGNTQYISWYELTPDFALVEQANGRIYRKGQLLPVFIKYYIAVGDSVESRVQSIIKVKGNLKNMMFSSYLKLKAPK